MISTDLNYVVMTFFSNTEYFAVYIGSNSALISMDLASMKSMMSHHSPAVHQQPLCSLITELVGLHPHFTHKDQEKESKLIKYIQSHF